MKKKPVTKIPMDIPKEYYAAIGEIAARWSWLDHQLGVIIRVGFGLGKPAGRVLTTGMGVKNKAHILRLLETRLRRNGTLANLIKDLRERTLKNVDNRNDLVHGLFGHMKDEPDKVVRYVLRSPEQRAELAAVPAPITAVPKVAAELRAIQLLAQEVTTALKALP